MLEDLIQSIKYGRVINMRRRWTPMTCDTNTSIYAYVQHDIYIDLVGLWALSTSIRIGIWILYPSSTVPSGSSNTFSCEFNQPGPDPMNVPWQLLFNAYQMDRNFERKSNFDARPQNTGPILGATLTYTMLLVHKHFLLWFDRVMLFTYLDCRLDLGSFQQNSFFTANLLYILICY